MFPFWGCTWVKKIEIAWKWIIFVQWNCHLWPKSKLEGREGEKNRSQKIRLNLRQLMDCLSHKTYLVDKISGFENNWDHFIFILKKIKTDLSSVLERERFPFCTTAIHLPNSFTHMISEVEIYLQKRDTDYGRVERSYLWFFIIFRGDLVLHGGLCCTSIFTTTHLTTL